MENKNLIQKVILVALLTSCTKGAQEEFTINIKEGIHHDDFVYSVTQYEIKDKIGEGTEEITANGNFYIVSFKVVNEALRVRHQWNNSVAYIRDEFGTIYNNDSSAQAKLEKVSPFGLLANYVTDCQTMQETKFVFDLPTKVKRPFLMVRGETLMGDFFDGGKFRRTKVRLF